MRQVSIITTVNHNVGDDFVREGILHLLEQALGPVRTRLIHKHLPVTARPEFGWYHTLKVAGLADCLRPGLGLRMSNRFDRLPLFPPTDRILNCDMLVQSGAPVYWAIPDGDCAHTEWWQPLIERRWLPRAAGRPFLNLAGGTCQHYHSDASEFARKPDVLAHIRRFFDLTALTTVRDKLSVAVLQQVNREAEVLPCTSLFAVDRLGIKPSQGRYVALNYMPGGGHYEFGQPIDAQAWEHRFTSFVRRLEQKEKCVLVCHNDRERQIAAKLLPEVEVFYSTHYRDFLAFYAEAKYGVMNRVHGAFALASLGKPSVVIGSDSRARMAELIGLDVRFVNDATEEWLEDSVGKLVAEIPDYPLVIEKLKKAAGCKYDSLLRAALRKHALVA